MTAWVARVVRVMPQAIWGVVILRGQEREGHGRLIARLHLQRRPVDGAAVQPRRRAGLEPAHRRPKPYSVLERPMDGGSTPIGDFHAAGRKLHFADMHQAVRNVPVVSTT